MKEWRSLRPSAKYCSRTCAQPPRVPRRCETCNETFTPGHRTAKFCSNVCYGRSLRNAEKKCEVCGDPFFPKHGRKRFCCRECMLDWTSAKLKLNTEHLNSRTNTHPALEGQEDDR
jgi:hypothetical protein